MILFLKNLLFTLVVPGTVAVYLPLRLVENRPAASGPVSAAGGLVLVAGACIYGWCVWDFSTFGRPLTCVTSSPSPDRSRSRRS
jgi:predicted membrane channel-forming protein YqfA (hemolysin III family)